MPLDMLIVFSLAAAAIVLFVLERLPVGLVSVMVATTLMLAGVLTTSEGLSGFSNSATITIAAMFALSEGVRRTGALERAGSLVTRTGGGGTRGALFAMMVIVGGVSALINNTAAIAIFIPVVMSVAATMDVSPSRFLMPVSFASMLGGACTLIGTSTNILVSEIAVEHGLAGIGMFELTPVGLAFLLTGFVFLLTIGRKLVPGRRSSERMSGFDLKQYITNVVVEEVSPLVGKPLGEDDEFRAGHIEIVDVMRDGREVSGRIPQVVPRAGDVLRIHGDARKVDRVVKRRGLRLSAGEQWRDAELEQGEHVLVEAVVGPDSPLVRRKIRVVDFGEEYGAVLLAIRQRGALHRDDIGEVRLRSGDCLLLAVDDAKIGNLERDHAMLPISRVSQQQSRHDKMPIALAVIAGVVAATALGPTPIVVNALVGVIIMVLTDCLKAEEGVNSVHWDVILLLAGMIPLGLAMEKTGAASLLAEGIADWLGAWGPQAVLSGLLLLTMLLTSILNNQASAVLLAPVVIEMAHALSVDPRAFLITVAYGASLSFITPVGYQTNTMIYGPGQYRFGDFFRVGIGLNLLLWIVGTLLIPLAWPLTQ